MNAKKMVALSNSIGVLSIILLVYWVFTFTLIQVFDLRIFGQNITSLFYLSIMGILALMFGALMINIMSNLTRIAEKHNDDVRVPFRKKREKIFWASVVLSFPAIALLLFFGNHATTQQKKEFMLHDVSEIITIYQNEWNTLVDYRFSKTWVDSTVKILKLSGERGRNDNLSLIVTDKINDNVVYLDFRGYSYSKKDMKKQDFYFYGSKEEKKYLADVFENHHEEPLFSAYRGNYRLFFPYRHNDKTVVFLITENLAYGKIGS